MKTDNQMTEPALPWVEGREDRLFRRMAIIFAVLFVALGFIINQIVLPQVKQKKLVEVAPRLARLIMQKKKQPPPSPLKKIIHKAPKKLKAKKPKPKAKPRHKEKVVKKKPVPRPDKRAAAKKRARQAGLIALSDELADLRDSFDVTAIAAQPQIKSGKKAQTVLNTSKLLSAKAGRGSGGIAPRSLTRKIKTSELAQRRTTVVKSSIASKQKILAKAGRRQSRKARRSQEEIERVFQRNKHSILPVYYHELRKDPSLQGKVVVELTIAPNGRVTKCIIVSSELNNKKLERRVISWIRKFHFADKNVPLITVTYPIDFLPS